MQAAWAEQARGVLKSVRYHLFTPYGLRTLSPDDPRYIPRYEGDRRQRDASYHMGIVWPWLLGPYFDAVAVVEGRDAARAELESILPDLRRHLADAGLGTVSEIFDAEAPPNRQRLHLPGLECSRNPADNYELRHQRK